MSAVVADTGVFSASLSVRRRPHLRLQVQRLIGRPIWLAVQSVAELRYGALVAGWGEPRRLRLEAAIGATTLVPITDGLIDEVARLRYECRLVGHPLHSEAHAGDLWIAAAARHIGAELAERMTTTKSVISRIESGQHRSSTETLRRLAEALDGHAVIGFEFDSEKPTRQDLVRL